MKQNKPIYLSTKDFLVSNEDFDLVFDSDREMLITHPMPDNDALGKYYESDQYISHTDNATGVFSFLYQSVKKWSLRKKVKLIRFHNKKPGSLLDVGAGTGEFLKVAKENSWTINGVEPNANAIALAKEKGIHLYKSLEDVNDQRFDVITLWHVLEHIPNLEEVIEDLSKLLEPGGILVIAVPNFKSYDAKHYKEFWAAFDTPRHLWHFSKIAMTKLFSQNFHLRRIEPMLFDSFYVSLLSEKYKTGKSFSLKAFWIGLVSNIKGMTNKEYSSHIYIFERAKTHS